MTSLSTASSIYNIATEKARWSGRRARMGYQIAPRRLLAVLGTSGSLRVQDPLMHSRMSSVGFPGRLIIVRLGWLTCAALRKANRYVEVDENEAWIELSRLGSIGRQIVFTGLLLYGQAGDFDLFGAIQHCLCNSKTAVVWKRFPFAHRHFYSKLPKLAHHIPVQADTLLGA